MWLTDNEEQTADHACRTRHHPYLAIVVSDIVSAIPPTVLDSPAPPQVGCFPRNALLCQSGNMGWGPSSNHLIRSDKRLLAREKYSELSADTAYSRATAAIVLAYSGTLKSHAHKNILLAFFTNTRSSMRKAPSFLLFPLPSIDTPFPSSHRLFSACESAWWPRLTPAGRCSPEPRTEGFASPTTLQKGLAVHAAGDDDRGVLVCSPVSFACCICPSDSLTKWLHRSSAAR